jgi:AcrR family transcriptional regulator
MGRPPRPDLRDALLEAARAEFAQHGLERARVADIARRAGVSKGAFYLHFSKKEEAFEVIAQRFLGAVEDQVRRRQEAEEQFARAHAGLEAPEYQRLQLELDCQGDLELLETLWRNRQLLAALDGAGGTPYQELRTEFRRRMRASLTRNMAEKQAAGRIRKDLDPTVMGDILLGSYEDFSRRMADMRGKPDLAGWLRTFYAVLYEGVLERPPTPAAVPAPPDIDPSVTKGSAR